MNGLFFSRVFLKARLFSVLYFGQMGDFTKAEKTDKLQDMEGKRKDQIETSYVQGLWLYVDWELNRPEAQVRGEGWTSDLWTIDGCVVMRPCE